MIPLLLKAPKGKQVRVVGLGPTILQALQDLRAEGWPITLHHPEGGGALASLPGIHITTDPPAAAPLRQASIVLIGKEASEAWRSEAKKHLEGTGIPTFDERDLPGSTLLIPRWIPGETFSMALWGGEDLPAWKGILAREFLRGTEDLYHSFSRLVGEMERLTLGSMEEGEFRDKIVTQIAQPSILSHLLLGDYEKARMLALRIVGTTTRSL